MCPRARRSRLTATLLTAALALLGVGGIATVVPAASAEEEFGLVLDEGHIDAFTLVWSNGQLGVRLQEDVTGHHVLHDADDVLLQVKEEARMTLPDPVPPNLSFLRSAGEDVYFLPQTQDPDLIWPGWSTERISASDFRSPLRIHIDEVDGPGDVFLWQTGSFGTSTPVLDSGSFRLPGAITANVNSHVHANWAFTEAGRYTLSVRATGTRQSGAAAASTPVTYTFDVGDVGTTPSTSPTPTTTPTTTRTTTPTSTPTTSPEPAPEGVWNVPNGKVNKMGATVLNDGHIDVASLLTSDGGLVTKVKDTTESSTPVWRGPSRTVLQLLPSSRTTVPDIPAYSFLGTPGASFYQVTQTQQSGLLWPGWSTESIPLEATTGGVAWALTDLSGPGDFALYETDSFGQPLVLVNTRDGIGAADRFTIPKNTHAHGSWAFSKQGTYCLSMQRVAGLPTGRTVADRFVLAVSVGRADVMSVDPARCGETVETDPPIIEPPDPDDTSDPDPADPDDSADPSGDPGTTAPVAGPSCVPTTTTGVASTSSPATVLSAGHIDYASRIVDGRLASSVGDDTSGTKVYREPSSTVLWLNPASRVTLPSGYEEVGPAGTTVWQVPQTQDPDLIWLGWSTELLNAGNARGPVTWSLDQVDGPGTVKIYLAGSFGGVQDVVLDGAGSSYDIALGVHAHGNWAFSEQGIYRLRTTQSVTLQDGTRSSDTEVLTIAVGDVDLAGAAASGTAPNTGGAASVGGCGAGAAPGAVTPETAAAVGAAPQAAAPTVGSTSGVTVGSDPVAPALTAGESAEDGRVPLLLGTLGTLLLLGAGGSGLLWWRRLPAARVEAVA